MNRDECRRRVGYEDKIASRRHCFTLVHVILMVFLAVALNGCSKGPGKTAKPPAPEVTVTKPVKKEVTQWLEATGTAAAIESVEIRARVQGFLKSIEFKPRIKVKAGDLLFVIDPKPFETVVAQREAVVKGKVAQLNLAQIELDKATQLAATQAISEIKLIEATSKRDLAKAEVDKAKADSESAKLDLEYTHVRSPIDGKVARNLVDVGNLVGAGEKTLLTTVVNDALIYVYFNMSEMDLLPFVRRYAENMKATPGEEKPQAERTPVYAGLGDEKGYSIQGHVDFADTRVDPGTGTIQVRAILPNEDGSIFPGMFLKVRAPLRKYTAFLVPSIAVQADQAGRYLLVVDDNNVVRRRKVKTGPLVEKMRVIDEGIKEGERVIVSGLQKARPGSPVVPIAVDAAQPQDASDPTTTPSSQDVSPTKSTSSQSSTN